MSQLPPLILTIVIQLAFGDLVVIGNPLFQVRIPCMAVSISHEIQESKKFRRIRTCGIWCSSTLPEYIL
jgi:hypothetical protein